MDAHAFAQLEHAKEQIMAYGNRVDTQIVAKCLDEGYEFRGEARGTRFQFRISGGGEQVAFVIPADVEQYRHIPSPLWEILVKGIPIHGARLALRKIAPS